MKPLAWYQIALPVAACVVLAVLALRLPRYRFALLGLVAMVGYAMLQDQVSVRLCPEYFTQLHPPIPNLTDPTLLGVGWGFLGAWWGGILLGYAVGLTATLGPRPKLSPRELVRPMLLLVGSVTAAAAITGVSVWRHAEVLGVSLDPGNARLVPAIRHRELLVVACYHFSAYACATLGGVALCVWVWTERRRRGRAEKVEPAEVAPAVPP
jgi:hypothetical protein